ncbi:CRISPR system precrRNA processing endoribonuclease RAMP protein Cas6, partial [candidate division KSB1 bacterium]|nr:CRISPR system precrRNA processing endoribonuclease RAMP protein Cas6 [candidate division KSB1 bacterium]
TDGLCRSLLRRASLLTKLHENSEWQIDYGDVIQRFNREIELKNNQTHAIRLERYSATQKRKHPLYALTGSAELCGNLQPFMPLLKTGEVIHIGGSTGQGLGKYRLS